MIKLLVQCKSSLDASSFSASWKGEKKKERHIYNKSWFDQVNIIPAWIVNLVLNVKLKLENMHLFLSLWTN